MSRPSHSLIDLQSIVDARGVITVAEAEKHVPFPIKRMFAITGADADMERGGHAHRQLHQLLICLAGNVAVEVDDGETKTAVILDKPGRALHVPPMLWASQRYSGPDAVLVVLCSDVYDEADYIRDHATFVAEAAKGN